MDSHSRNVDNTQHTHTHTHTLSRFIIILYAAHSVCPSIFAELVSFCFHCENPSSHLTGIYLWVRCCSVFLLLPHYISHKCGFDVWLSHCFVRTNANVSACLCVCALQPFRVRVLCVLFGQKECLNGTYVCGCDDLNGVANCDERMITWTQTPTGAEIQSGKLYTHFYIVRRWWQRQRQWWWWLQ